MFRAVVGASGSSYRWEGLLSEFLPVLWIQRYDMSLALVIWAKPASGAKKKKKKAS